MQPAPRLDLRAVFDTNLFVSYLLTHRPPIATLIDVHLAEHDFVLITSVVLLKELERVLAYPKLQVYFVKNQGRRFLALISLLGEVVETPEFIPRICRDPEDDEIVACAVSGNADVIVSGDADLLDLARVGGILVLSLAQFLELLNQRLVRREETPIKS